MMFTHLLRDLHYLRWRTISNNVIAAQAAAFSESIGPGIGIVTECDAALISAADKPLPSLPIRKAVGFVN